MQFLVMSRRRSEDFPQEEFDRLFADEASRAREFYAAGFTRHIWHRVDHRCERGPRPCELWIGPRSGEL